MKAQLSLAALGLATCLAPASLAQHAQVSAVAVEPTNHQRVWVANRDNDSVSLIDVATQAVLAEVPVGVSPRSLALSHDGARLFVANQRGNVPLSANTVTGFPPGSVFGSVSVIDTASRTVQAVLTNVGTEPYGVAVAPNGKYFAVSGFRSATIKFYDLSSLAEVQSFQYLADMNFIPLGSTVADVDANRDGIPDVGDPRGFVIRSDSQRMYVTHNKSPYVSVLDITLDGSGLPTGVVMAKKIDLNEYPFDTFLTPTPVQTVQSQGLPRFLEDIALSPDATLALVPHLLHNVNHDVNHDFGPGFPGDFANRVYPALTAIDAVLDSYGQLGDASLRLHNELSDPVEPAEYSPFGDAYVMASSGNPLTLGGAGTPSPGGSATFVVGGWRPGDQVWVMLGSQETNRDFGNGHKLLVVRRKMFPAVNGVLTVPLSPSLAQGSVIVAQAYVVDGLSGTWGLSNGLRVRVSSQGLGTDKMGHRAGHPSRVLFNAAGDRAVMLNRGSEDLFLYRVTGSSMRLLDVFPPRLYFEERAALDTTTPMGDLPLGMAMVPDPTTDNDDALIYVVNEGTRTLSSIRVDFTTGTFHPYKAQIPTLLGPDDFTPSERLGQEIFEDASRAQTTGLFNNSCASCHFEGGEDSNVWQRTHGPRSTMPVFGGRLGTGLVLWKGVRVNMGETGPMFGGENGGHGLFSDAEQQALTDYHEKIPFPLSPMRDPQTGALSAQALLGRDLFFGTNDTGLNPTGRHANCFECHPSEVNTGSNPGPRFFTADFLPPAFSGGENFPTFDPNCFSLRENIAQLNIRNVNTGVNVDIDNDSIPDVDRNFDGYDDRETYVPMNLDGHDDFQRDDPNSYPCPCDPTFESNCDPVTGTRIFTRAPTHFSIPTKMSVFSSAPYFHDHVVFSLRALLDPAAQMIHPVYGDPAYGLNPTRPGTMKIFNEAHDVRGHETFVPGASKVQLTLLSTDVEADIDAILAFISSL